MTDQAVARRVPWATVIGWLALLLAIAGATGVVVAGAFAVQGAREPQSFGDLGAAVVLMFALVPSLPALVVAIVQSRRGWAPRWRTRSTAVLAGLAPVAFLVVVVGNLVA